MVTWDTKAVKPTPIGADEVLIIDTENVRNQKRATLDSVLVVPWAATHDANGNALTNASNVQSDSFEIVNAGAGGNQVFSSNAATPISALDGPSALTPGATTLQINQNGTNNTISIPYSILELRARDSDDIATVPIFRIDASFQGNASNAAYLGFIEFVGIAAADEVVFMDYSTTLNKINIRGALDMNGDHIQEVDFIEFETNGNDSIPDADPDAAIRLPNDRFIAFGDSASTEEWHFGLTTLEHFEFKSSPTDGIIRIDMLNPEQEALGAAYETGGIRIRGLDSGGVTTTWAEIVCKVNDNTSLAEDSTLWLEVFENGSSAQPFIKLNDATSLTNILFLRDLDISTFDIITDTVTGTKIGTATNEKIGFFNATPIIQPVHIADPTGGATVDAEARTAINSILSQLAALGLQAAA